MFNNVVKIDSKLSQKPSHNDFNRNKILVRFDKVHRPQVWEISLNKVKYQQILNIKNVNRIVSKLV